MTIAQSHDEVRQVGHWTVASRDGAHIALWSWRAPTWRKSTTAHT